MATSGVTNWPLTAGEFVTQAMVELGALSSGEEPDSAEMTDALIRLNAMLKTWSRKANLFRDATATLTVTGGAGAVTLEQGVRDINSLRHVISATNYRLLSPWNRDQFYSLPNRSAAGNPTIYYLSRGLDSVALRLWPVPAADITLHIDYSRTAETVTEPGETIDISQELGETVILGLARRIANMFGATRIDAGTVQRVERDADRLEQELFDSDRPDSYMFEAWDSYDCA